MLTIFKFMPNRIFILSIISGFPLGIIYSGIFIWLQESKVDIILITSFLIVRIPYSLKFIWGNMIEYLSSGYIKSIGAKKSWLILSVVFMSIILLILSYISPQEELFLIYFLSFLLATVSSIYDTSFESFRLEYIRYFGHNTSQIVTWSSFGHKFGVLFSSVWNLIVADYTGWSQAFFSSSVILLLSVLYIITIKDFYNYEKYNLKSYFLKILKAYEEFSSRNLWKFTLVSVLFLKMGKTMLSSTILIYYSFLGFSKTQLAFWSNIYDFFVFCLGTGASYYFVRFFKYKRTLIMCFLAQICSYPMFIILGHSTSLSVWIIITTIDGLLTGMIVNVFIIYLNKLVDSRFLVIQYSFLVSMSNIFNNLISLTSSGLIIKFLGWNVFFIFAMIFSIPGLIAFIIANK